MITTRFARACLLAFAIGSAAPSFAVPLMDLRAEDLLFMSADVRKSLNLTPNQQTLWNQMEGRSRAILRERQRRREALMVLFGFVGSVAMAKFLLRGEVI